MRKAAHSYSYTDQELLDMRRQLAKMWKQSIGQVTDTEARWYLDLERELVTATSRPAP